MTVGGVHLLISGLVQGVGYRYYIYRKAAGYGLQGFVRNLPNGDVEVKAFGTRAMLEALLTDARIGPRSAMVTNVAVNWLEKEEKFNGFELR